MNAAPPSPGVSEDALLDGRVRLLQPVDGYRVAIDPVLLAAAVPAAAGDTVLDVGCGVGAAALCLATRVAGIRVTAIDSDAALIRLAVENIGLNELSDRVQAMSGDLLRPPPRLEPGSFAHVMANPPFLLSDRVTAPAHPGKKSAHLEGAADLAAWVRFAFVMLRAKGGFTLIHRADRLDAVLAQLSAQAGEITVFPLWSGPGKPAKRVIVRARKGVATPMRLLAGLVLHDADGRYSDAADAVLRRGGALPLD